MIIIKRFFLTLLSILCLSAGLIAIVLERQSVAAQEKVKSWTPSQCLMTELVYHYDYFTSTCMYNVNGTEYVVQNQTPVWNTYFDLIAGTEDSVEIFYIDSDKKKNRFNFKKGAMTNFWYDPQKPQESILMPGAGSLRGFLYFGIGFYLFLGLAAVAGSRRSKASGNQA